MGKQVVLIFVAILGWGSLVCLIWLWLLGTLPGDLDVYALEAALMSFTLMAVASTGLLITDGREGS
jgi:hypothetical protein